MTTSPLKVEDSRADFEKWCAEITGYTSQFLRQYRKEEGYAEDFPYFVYWLTWQASRAAIVVELPDYNGDIDDELSCFDGEYEWGNRAGANYAVTQCAGIIRAAGITVKGDSDEANANAS